jgi:putative phosphoribosyl transferase
METMTHLNVEINAGRAMLPGELVVPAEPSGVVVFAHGSGSSRRSPRNIGVANSLNHRGCSTLLFDLLSPSEAADRRNVFDIGLLADRVVGATQHLRKLALMSGLPIGYFGASTGAAAALLAAAQSPSGVVAVVSRGGRPDLAGAALPKVQAATLLIVGSEDHEVLILNQQAQRMLRCENDLVIIEGATHLFEEPGTLDAAAAAAANWFVRHFAPSPD